MRALLALALLAPGLAAAQTTVTTVTTTPSGQSLPVTVPDPVAVVPGPVPLNVNVLNSAPVAIPNPLPVIVTNPPSPPLVIPNPMPVTQSAPVTVLPGTIPLNVTVTNPGSGGITGPIATLPGTTGGIAGGKTASIVLPNTSAPIAVLAAATVQIVPPVAGQAIYVTDVTFMSAAGNSVQFVYGTGAGCVTGRQIVTGVYPVGTNGGLAEPVFWVIPAGNGFCVITTAPLGGSISYAQF